MANEHIQQLSRASEPGRETARKGSRLRQSLAGMSYAEQLRLVQPKAVQLKVAGYDVQLSPVPEGQETRPAEVKVAPAPTVQLHGFRGVREVRGKKVKELDASKPEEKAELDEIQRCHLEDHLIIAGHIGVSADGGASIYGLTPKFPEGMTVEQGIQHLYDHTQTFPGVVSDDKPVFDRAANYAATRGWNTNVVVASRPVSKKGQADLLQELQRLAGMAPGTHGIYYSFPLSDAQAGQYFVDTPDGKGNVIKGECQGNCATFPAFVQVALPEQSGNLRYYMPALEAEARQ